MYTKVRTFTQVTGPVFFVNRTSRDEHVFDCEPTVYNQSDVISWEKEGTNLTTEYVKTEHAQRLHFNHDYGQYYCINNNQRLPIKILLNGKLYH